MKFSYPSCFGLFALTTASVFVSAGSLAADDRDDRVVESFRHSHVYTTQLRNTDITVEVKKGVAVLKGTAENEDQRRLAEDTVRGISGVERIDNRVRVTREPKESSDEWITLKARSALLFHRNVSATDTHVTVRDGVVILTGTANSEAEKELAGSYANDIRGVRRVDNQIQVVNARDERREPGEMKSHLRIKDEGGDERGRSAESVIDDASITAQVKSALAVRKSTSAVHTEVTTRDGIVTLRGEARNGAEKDLVTKLAENIEGVRTVHNDMTVQNR